MRSYLAASASALAVQPLVLQLFLRLLPEGVLHEDPGTFKVWFTLGTAAVAVATVHLFALGLPLFYVLRRLAALTWPNVLAIGALSGSLPIFCLLLWASRAVQNGPESTFFDSTSIFMSAWFATQGVAGAAAFFFVWRRMQANYAFKRTAETVHGAS
jgi:hypothetical protein